MQHLYMRRNYLKYSTQIVITEVQCKYFATAFTILKIANIFKIQKKYVKRGSADSSPSLNIVKTCLIQIKRSYNCLGHKNDYK